MDEPVPSGILVQADEAFIFLSMCRKYILEYLANDCGAANTNQDSAVYLYVIN